MTRPPKQTTLSIPPELATRLRQIATVEKHDSIFDLLSSYVRKEMERGVIPRDIPGIRVDVEKDEVYISAKEFTLAVQRQFAGRLADTLRKVARKDVGPAVPGVEIKRTGRAGLKIEQPDTKAFLALSDTTATELADLIEEKAATA